MEARFIHAIKYVGDMDKAVRFHRDTLGFALKFQTPGVFATGDVTLALHAATADNPAGTMEPGFGVPGVADVYANRNNNGLIFKNAPRELHGKTLAMFLDSDGAVCSLSSG